jgi:hypothetical protein
VAFTGKLGTSDSKLGNVQLGTAPSGLLLQSEVTGASIRWYWNTQTGVTSYVLQTDDSNAFPSPTEYIITAPTVEYTENSVPNGTYYGRVKTRTAS